MAAAARPRSAAPVVRAPFALQQDTVVASPAGTGGASASSRTQQQHGAAGATDAANSTSASGARPRSANPERLQVVSHHRAPRYNIFGQCLKDGQKDGVAIPRSQSEKCGASTQVPFVPQSWESEPTHQTRAELKAARKKEGIPDPSFDLDGDGVVSAQDFFLAHKFDADKDGRLNEQELSTAKLALSSGYGKRFTRVAGAATMIEHRVLQKNGHILSEESDGWMKLKHQVQPAYTKAPFAPEENGGTAAASPRYAKRMQASASTRSELMQGRRMERIQSGLEATGMATQLPREPDAETPLPPATATSRSQLLAQRKKGEKKGVLSTTGLHPDYADPTVVAVDVKLNHKCSTRGELLKARSTLFKEEAARMAPTKPPGVHRTVLPSFDGTLTAQGATWFQQPPAEVPEYAPLTWAESPADRMVGVPRLTGDKQLSCSGRWPLSEEGPDDPFKTRSISVSELRTKRASKNVIVQKPTEVEIPMKICHDNGPPVIHKRWTDFVLEFQADRQTAPVDATGKTTLIDPRETEPLFSSFSRNHIFEPTMPGQRVLSPEARQRRASLELDTGAPAYGRPAAANPRPTVAELQAHARGGGNGNQQGVLNLSTAGFKPVNVTIRPASQPASTVLPSPGAGVRSGGFQLLMNAGVVQPSGTSDDRVEA